MLLEESFFRQPPPPHLPDIRIKIKNIHANSIADVASGEAIKVPRFSLAPNNNINLAESQKHPIGFAIASPILNLKEGERTIILTIGCDKNSLNTDDISNIRKIIQENNPFEVYLSSETEWIKIESPVVQLGDPILKSGEETKETKDTYLNSYSLWFKINLAASVPAIAPLNSDALKDKITARYPAIKIVLKTRVIRFNNIPIIWLLLREINCMAGILFLHKSLITYYEQLKSICLEKVNIQVTASNVKDIQIRNDSSVLDSKSLFQPFGNNPKVGSSFYFSNSEIISKKLESLTLNLQWMGLPKDFQTHYQAYKDTRVITQQITNESFTALLQFFNNRSWRDNTESQPLFIHEGKLSSKIVLNYSKLFSDGQKSSSDIDDLETDDPLEYNSYFKLELQIQDQQNLDYGHDLYPTVLNKVALATATETSTAKEDSAQEAIKIKSLTVYPPYTPQLKNFTLDYKASVEIDLKDKSNKKANTSQIFQLHPVGYTKIPTEGQNYLLPQYPEAAALYIGIRNLQPPQNLSILFQMLSESGNVELTRPKIKWSYLNQKNWQDFADTEILADTTNELLNTGIIRFSIPKAANSEHQLLPTDLYWLRARVNENPTAIPDILDIKTQAVQATYINQGNATQLCITLNPYPPIPFKV